MLGLLLLLFKILLLVMQVVFVVHCAMPVGCRRCMPVLLLRRLLLLLALIQQYFPCPCTHRRLCMLLVVVGWCSHRRTVGINTVGILAWLLLL